MMNQTGAVTQNISSISASLYLCSKSGYSDLRDSDLIQLPSPQLLRGLSKDIKCYLGNYSNNIFILNHVVHML